MPIHLDLNLSKDAKKSANIFATFTVMEEIDKISATFTVMEEIDKISTFRGDTSTAGGFPAFLLFPFPANLSSEMFKTSWNPGTLVT